MNNSIYFHTRKLIQHGIFHSLNNKQVSEIYIALLSENSQKAEAILLKWWRLGDFYATVNNLKLLEQTNNLLKTFNQPLIDGPPIFQDSLVK